MRLKRILIASAILLGPAFVMAASAQEHVTQNFGSNIYNTGMPGGFQQPPGYPLNVDPRLPSGWYQSWMTSPNGLYGFVLQEDCNLAHYRLDGSPVGPHPPSNPAFTGWATDTVETAGNTCWLSMQDDGNLVLYTYNSSHVGCGFLGAWPCTPKWNVVWSSGTNGNPGAYLRIQNDGNVVIYSVHGIRVLWSMWYGRTY
jgi:hypothetical protein